MEQQLSLKGRKQSQSPSGLHRPSQKNFKWTTPIAYCCRRLHCRRFQGSTAPQCQGQDVCTSRWDCQGLGDSTHGDKSLNNYIWISKWKKKCVLRGGMNHLEETDYLSEKLKDFFPTCFRHLWDITSCLRKKGKFPSLWRLLLFPRIVMEQLLTGNSRFTSTLGKS